MKRRLFSALILTLLNQSTLAMGKMDIMKNKNSLISPLKTKLSIDITGEKIWVSITYSNISNKPIYMLKENPRIWIYQNEQKIDYVGILAKKNPPTLQDHEKIEPNQMSIRKFEISDDYKFLKGSHSYEFRLNDGYEDPITHDNFEADSIKVVKKYTSQHGYQPKR
jgi:hypothetical protein